MKDGKPSAIDVFKLLDRSNCGECGVPSCFGFASLVVSGDKRPQDCPQAPAELLERFAETLEGAAPGPVADETLAAEIEAVKREVADLDLAEAALRTDGELRRIPEDERTDDDDGDRLIIRCLGKPFELDSRGELHATIHINAWIHGPLLHYALRCEGVPHSGEWVRFADLQGADDWTRFFAHRCENGLQQLGGKDPDLLIDAISLFGADAEASDLPESGSGPDRAIVLHPLPRVRMMNCYWHADADFEARWTILFDRACERNLDAGSIYVLTQGFLEMLTRILERHEGVSYVEHA